jgi:hypothetical protein
MRHRIRIQPYLTPDTHRKMRAHAAGNGVTESAVAEAALAEYLSRDSLDGPLMLRRLDGLARGLQQLQHDIDVLSQAFGIVARHSFLAAPVAPSAEDRKRADVMYQALITRVATDLASGMRFAGAVSRAQARKSGSEPLKGQ